MNAPWLTIHELAKALKVSIKTVRRAYLRGEIPVQRIFRAKCAPREVYVDLSQELIGDWNSAPHFRQFVAPAGREPGLRQGTVGTQLDRDHSRFVWTPNSWRESTGSRSAR
jgi:hypothetical protein